MALVWLSFCGLLHRCTVAHHTIVNLIELPYCYDSYKSIYETSICIWIRFAFTYEGRLWCGWHSEIVAVVVFGHAIEMHEHLFGCDIVNDSFRRMIYVKRVYRYQLKWKIASTRCLRWAHTSNDDLTIDVGKCSQLCAEKRSHKLNPSKANANTPKFYVKMYIFVWENHKIIHDHSQWCVFTC